MRLWEKNFLITLALFTVLFYICMFIVAASSFSSALSSERDAALREEGMIRAAIQNEINDVDPAGPTQNVISQFAPYGSYYHKRGIDLALYRNGFRLTGSLPFRLEEPVSESRSCGIISAAGAKYMYIGDTLIDSGEEYLFMYVKDISALYGSLLDRITLLTAMGAAVTLVFALGLYFALKKVYRPIGNLAHELKTPLTSIRGYAEYLQAAASTEEDRYSAAKYIIDESKRLSDVCDKLLILANLHEGEISFEKIDIKELFENAKMTFKNVEYEADAQYLRGNKTLL